MARIRYATPTALIPFLLFSIPFVDLIIGEVADKLPPDPICVLQVIIAPLMAQRSDDPGNDTRLAITIHTSLFPCLMFTAITSSVGPYKMICRMKKLIVNKIQENAMTQSNIDEKCLNMY